MELSIPFPHPVLPAPPVRPHQSLGRIEQFFYILLAFFCGTTIFSRTRIQIIGKLLKYGKCSCRVKSNTYAFSFLWICPNFEQARILCSECRLHIKCRRTHITKHQHCCPFRNGNSCRKLSYRQCNGLFMLGNGSNHFIIRFHGFIIIIQFPSPAARTTSYSLNTGCSLTSLPAPLHCLPYRATRRCALIHLAVLP